MLVIPHCEFEVERTKESRNPLTVNILGTKEEGRFFKANPDGRISASCMLNYGTND